MDHFHCHPLQWAQGRERARLAVGECTARYPHGVLLLQEGRFTILAPAPHILSLCKGPPNEPRAYTKASPGSPGCDCENLG